MVVLVVVIVVVSVVVSVVAISAFLLLSSFEAFCQFVYDCFSPGTLL